MEESTANATGSLSLMSVANIVIVKKRAPSWHRAIRNLCYKLWGFISSWFRLLSHSAACMDSRDRAEPAVSLRTRGREVQGEGVVANLIVTGPCNNPWARIWPAPRVTSTEVHIATDEGCGCWRGVPRGHPPSFSAPSVWRLQALLEGSPPRKTRTGTSERPHGEGHKMSTLTSELVTEASLSLRLETALGDRNFTPLSTSKGTRPSASRHMCPPRRVRFPKKSSSFLPSKLSTKTLAVWPKTTQKSRLC